MGLAARKGCRADELDDTFGDFLANKLPQLLLIADDRPLWNLVVVAFSNFATDIVRSHGRRERLFRPLDPGYDVGAPALPPVDRLAEGKLLALVKASLPQLPPLLRDALEAYCTIEGTHAEVGFSLGISAGAAKARVRRARLEIRQLIQQRHVPFVYAEVQDWAGLFDRLTSGLDPSCIDVSSPLWRLLPPSSQEDIQIEQSQIVPDVERRLRILGALNEMAGEGRIHQDPRFRFFVEQEGTAELNALLRALLDSSEANVAWANRRLFEWAVGPCVQTAGWHRREGR